MGEGGEVVGTWAAELMRHASKMLQYLRIGALLKRVTPEVLAIRQSWNYNKVEITIKYLPPIIVTILLNCFSIPVSPNGDG